MENVTHSLLHIRSRQIDNNLAFGFNRAPSTTSSGSIILLKKRHRRRALKAKSKVIADLSRADMEQGMSDVLHDVLCDYLYR